MRDRSDMLEFFNGIDPSETFIKYERTAKKSLRRHSLANSKMQNGDISPRHFF